MAQRRRTLEGTRRRCERLGAVLSGARVELLPLATGHLVG